MKKLFANVAVILMIFTGLIGISLMTPTTASAAPGTPQSDICDAIGGTAGSSGCETSTGPTLTSVVKTIINILSLIVGIIAVIMIVIAGLRFITSGGDSNGVASARSTILYAIIGIVVVVLAQAIVQFVLNKVK